MWRLLPLTRAILPLVKGCNWFTLYRINGFSDSRGTGTFMTVLGGGLFTLVCPPAGTNSEACPDYYGEASPDSEPNRHFHGAGFRTHRKCSVTRACGFHCGWEHLSRESHSLSSPKIHVVLFHLPFETNRVVLRYSKQLGCSDLQSSRLKVLISTIL